MRNCDFKRENSYAAIEKNFTCDNFGGSNGEETTTINYQKSFGW